MTVTTADFEPGTYVVTFERIGRQRPQPLTVTVGDADDMATQIHRYADARTGSSDIFVCVEPPEPGRSIATGWISAGGRDAGRFTWRAQAAAAAAVEIEEN
jgi:hypothetical protein